MRVFFRCKEGKCCCWHEWPEGADLTNVRNAGIWVKQQEFILIWTDLWENEHKWLPAAHGTGHVPENHSHQFSVMWATSSAHALRNKLKEQNSMRANLYSTAQFVWEIHENFIRIIFYFPNCSNTGVACIDMDKGTTSLLYGMIV